MATNKIRLSMLTEADLVALLGILNDDVSLFPSLDCEAPMGGPDEGACGRRRIRWRRS